MQEQNKNRLALITGRFAARQADKAIADRRSFDEAFVRAREAVIIPVLEEIAEELRRAGHAPEIRLDQAEDKPSVELCLGIRGRSGKNLVAYTVIARRPEPEVLAYLDVDDPVMDLLRYPHPSAITREMVEQVVVDAVEHIFACHST